MLSLIIIAEVEYSNDSERKSDSEGDRESDNEGKH